jgi:23S rRNA pseudouridine2605 synthase
MRGSPKASNDESERLHKRIANAGLASRRAAEKMILDGRVEVNGVTVTELGVKVDPDDDIRVDGRAIAAPKHYYLVMNKPTGYVTTMSDPQRRPTVAKLLPKLDSQLKPIGRLDMDSEGLLVFTNDGEFANRMAHPKFEIEKEYHAIVKGKPDDKALEKLRKGVYVEGRRTAPAKVWVEREAGKDQADLRLILHEGRKRQVRLMCDSVGHPVVSLKRVRIGSLRLGKMRRGECRMLSKDEVETLKKELGLT